MSERSAISSKSKKSVRQSDPGRTPANQSQPEAACSFTGLVFYHVAAPSTIDDSEIAALIQFFQTLDQWDRERSSGPFTVEAKS
jgi:hypothetical protein